MGHFGGNIITDTHSKCRSSVPFGSLERVLKDQKYSEDLHHNNPSVNPYFKIRSMPWGQPAQKD